jgi:hypothetical protein
MIRNDLGSDPRALRSAIGAEGCAERAALGGSVGRGTLQLRAPAVAALCAAIEAGQEDATALRVAAPIDLSLALCPDAETTGRVLACDPTSSENLAWCIDEEDASGDPQNGGA